MRSLPVRQRNALNLAVDPKLVAEARSYGINLSELLHQAMLQRLRAEREERWRAENAEAIAHNNAEMEKVGLWSDDLRSFG
jgi:antitoxin CcdA